MRVLLYRDYGVSQSMLAPLHDWLIKSLPHHTIEFTDAASVICKNALAQKDVCAFVLPGGWSQGYSDKLAGEGDRKILRFVQQGGLFYGVCAGAYYPCRFIDFEGKGARIQKINKKLVFFNGVGRGCLPQLTNGYDYSSADFMSSNVVPVDYGDGHEAMVYYHGGPVFVGDFSKASCEVLSRYKELPAHQNASAVKCSIGEGAAILLSMHPDITSSYIDDLIHKGLVPMTEARTASQRLRKYSQKNKHFSDYILKDIYALS